MNYGVIFLLILTFSGLSAFEFSDDFSTNSLKNPNQYVEAYEGFKIKSGALRVDGKAGFGGWLNILPALGRNATLSVDIKHAAGSKAHVRILADWRYREIGPFASVSLSFDRQWVTFTDDWNAGRQVALPSGKYVSVRLERREDTLTVFVADEQVLQRSLPEKSGVVSTQAEAAYGGFALALGWDDVERSVEFDNLRISGDDSPVVFKSLIKEFKIKNDPYLFSVIYEQGFEAWAAGQADVSAKYIGKTFELYGVPPIHRRLGMVQSRGDYFEANNGYNTLGFVSLRGRNEDAQAVNCHELGHNWQHLYSKRWNTEGSADLSCYFNWEKDYKALMQVSNMRLDARFKQDMIDNGGAMDIDTDAYLNFTGMPGESLAKSGWKARTFYVILYRILGPAGFRQLHQKARALGHGMNSEEMKAFAEQISGRDLSGVFNGWVYKGETSLPIGQIFADSDGDGLSDLDEKLFSTDPQRADTDGDGYADLGEIMSGFNPLDAKSPGAGRIVIDGQGTDWQNIPVAVDDADEGKGDADIKAIRFQGDLGNRLMYARVDYYQALFASDKSKTDSYLTFDFDLDKDGKTDFRVNFFPGTSAANAFLARNLAWGQWQSIAADGAQSAYGNENGSGFIEVCIPLKIIENAKSFNLSVSAGSPAGQEWLKKNPISVELSGSFAALPGNLWTPPAWH